MGNEQARILERLAVAYLPVSEKDAIVAGANALPLPDAAERVRVERMVVEQALAAIADGEGDAQIIARSTLSALSAVRGAK